MGYKSVKWRERVLRTIFLMLATGWLGAAWAAPPSLEMRDLDGDLHRLSDYRGKWVVVNYWATWCPPCLDELPELGDFHERHKDRDAVVLGVNMEEIDRDELARFVDEQFITFPIFPGNMGMETVGPVPGLPTTFLVGPDGRRVARRLGGVTAGQLEEYIDAHQSGTNPDVAVAGFK